MTLSIYDFVQPGKSALFSQWLKIHDAQVVANAFRKEADEWGADYYPMTIRKTLVQRRLRQVAAKLVNDRLTAEANL